MSLDVVTILEQMVDYGQAPDDGCNLFGVGYEQAFSDLRDLYLTRRFQAGRAAEKFVVGPYGSGKTHFLRQLMEIARSMGCVTAEVSLNKELEFTRSLIVYREIARQIRISDTAATRGIRPLLIAALDQKKKTAPGNAALGQQICQRWVLGLDMEDFEWATFGRVVRMTLEAHLGANDVVFEAGCRWLGGDIGDKGLAKSLGVSAADRTEENLYGTKMMFSLFQFVCSAGFPGTVVSYDEAEQGLQADKRKLERIHALLQSEITRMATLKGAPALVVYAFTDQVIEEVDKHPALQSRLANPEPGKGFFDGSPRAPIIDLRRKGPSGSDLQAIGHKLVDLLYDQCSDRSLTVDKQTVREAVDRLAVEVAEADPTSSNRRAFVKWVSNVLLRLHDRGVLDLAPPPDHPNPESEV